MPVRIALGTQTPVKITGAPGWDADEFVTVKPFKNGFMTMQASYVARNKPEGYTDDEIKDMDQDEYNKLSWNSGLFHAELFRQMFAAPDANGTGGWHLRDANGTNLEWSLDLVSEIFDDEQAQYILSKISELGKGPKAAPIVDPATGAEVPSTPS